MSNKAIMEKLRARRRAMRESLNETNDIEKSLKSENDTWGAALDDPREANQSPVASDTNMEVIDEIKESENLVNDLSKRRRQRKKELSKALKGQDDIHEEIRSAKTKSRKKIEELQQQQEDERAEALEEVTPLGDIEEDEVDAGPASAMSTGRKKGLLETAEDAGLSASGSLDGRTPRKTPRSLNESMRERLRSRVQSAKEKAETEVKEEVRPGRRLRRERPLTTRFDDSSVLTKEDYETEQVLEKSQKLRSKWKKAADTAVGKPFIPNVEEQYDFFTRNWDPQPEEGAAEEEEEKTDTHVDEDEAGPSSEMKDEQSQEETSDKDGEVKKKKDQKKAVDEEEKPLLEDFIAAEAESWKFYQYGRAVYTPFQERLKKEDEVCFVPSMRAAPTSEKIFEQEQPRYLEDEGFYVGTRPPVSLRNVHRLENRLLKQPDKGKDWFGEDGRVIALPDALKEIPSRPPVPEEPDPYLQTDFQKAVMREFDTRYIDGSLDGQGQYQLDVDINTISFSHHHLFSREHVLAARITEQYRQYVNTQQVNAVQFLTEKIRALRGAITHLQENIQNLKAQGKDDQKFSKDQSNRLQDYRYEIRQTRKHRDSGMHGERTLLRNIITTWKEIKKLRAFQNCTNTAVRLQIKKEGTNKSEDEMMWQQDLEEEIEDQRSEYEEEYTQQMARYSTLLEEWRSQRKTKREATKRKKKHKKGGNEESADDEELIQRDEEILNEDDIPKPNKPVPFSEAEVRERIQEKFMEIRRRPGEPKLYPELTNTVTITPKNQCPRGEQSRRDDVDRTKIFVKVIYNNKEVSRTSAKPLGQEFKVNFAFIYNILIVQWPESIKLQVFESSGLSSSMQAEIFIAIPEATVTAENVQLEEVEFSSDHRVAHNHEGVGSGVLFSFESDNSNMISLLTTGNLGTSVAWGIDENGQVLVPSTGSQVNKLYSAMKGMDALAAIGASGLTDMDKLTKWIAESRLDPNDPSNADLIALLRPGGDGRGSDLRLPEHFRLEQLQEEFNFATDQDFETSRRFTMIQYREQEIPEFRNYKLIPAIDKECPQDILQEYEKKKKEAERLRLKDDEESHRIAVAKFMQQVREQVIERFRIASHQKNLSDVVYEEMVPNIGTIIPNLLKMTEPRRPLKPIRKERKKVTAQNLQTMDVKILINIVRAYDIPVRTEAVSSQTAPTPRPGQAGTSAKPTVRNIAGEILVRPFIEASFQRNQQSTSVADGPNPSWNEELAMPFKAPNNDYSSSNLQTVNDVVYLNLFDEYVVDVLQDDRERQTNIQYRKEKRWLGSIKIPFSTIYFNSRIDGTFRVNKPPVLLGYTSDAQNNTVESGGNTFDVGMGEKDVTYLTMFITIEPQLTPPEPAEEKFESNEEEKLLEYAEKFQSELKAKWDKREYKVTVVDINGKSVFITRYFKALKPPQDVLDQNTNPDATAELVARYVALIPFVSDSVVFPGMCDIWSTCDQFLQMLQGDEEEHAVLLTNYFLHLGKKTWLLLGSAIPEGPTAYVLTKEANDYWVWNASTGDHWSYRDSHCPVQSVGCLVNNENIWANIQQSDQPCRVSFDLNNTKNWRPFFQKNLPNPGLSSVQPENLIYFKTDPAYVLDLQDKVERILKEKVMEWRPRHITRWNRYCIQAFRSMLVKLEETRGKGVHDDHMKELDKILGSYKLCGFPINMPYTEMEPIIEAVYATGVHVQETSNVEFAIAAHIHPYPNSVLSVWVYVASLVRKR